MESPLRVSAGSSFVVVSHPMPNPRVQPLSFLHDTVYPTGPAPPQDPRNREMVRTPGTALLYCQWHTRTAANIQCSLPGLRLPTSSSPQDPASWFPHYTSDHFRAGGRIASGLPSASVSRLHLSGSGETLVLHYIKCIVSTSARSAISASGGLHAMRP